MTKTKFYKVRGNAILIAILIILLSTLFGVNRSLGGKVMEISDLFNDGVRSGGYTLKSIRSQLIVRAEASMNLITVGTNYEAASAKTKELQNARNAMMDLLEDREASPAALYAANLRLGNAFEALYGTLTGLTLSQEDASYIDTDYSRMNNAALVIDKSEYNETVRDFNRDVLSVFPTNILRKICFVSEPELFE